MVGSAIRRRLEDEGFENVIYRSSSELDLRNQQQVQAFLKKKLDVVIALSLRMGSGQLISGSWNIWMRLKRWRLRVSVLEN